MPRIPTDPHAPDTAEDWMARLLAPDCDDLDRQAFERWRAADPAHGHAFDETAFVHRSVARLGDDPMLRAAARAARRQTRPRWHWLPSAAAAAALLLAIGVGYVTLRGRDMQRYASGAGIRSLQLDDGSRIWLDAGAVVRVRVDAHAREVILDRGRAAFAVTHDPDRPFTVHAGASIVRDIGTTFQVRRDRAGVTVGLLEGAVQVSGNGGGNTWSTRLLPAQQLHVDANGRAGTLAPLDTEAAEAWPTGDLVFHSQRLDALVATMNRYATTKLRLGDPSLAALRVSGSFHAGDQRALASALERGWKLRAVSTGSDELTLLPAAHP